MGSARQIAALCSRGNLRNAVRAGEIERVTRGRYALAGVRRHRRVAAEMSAVCSHLSAAQHWGWKVVWPPDRAWVTVPRNRKVDSETQALVHVVYADLEESEIRDGVTSPLRTVIDCARRLPFAEAFAVADSALRAGDVTAEELRVAATRVRGRGARQCRRVAAEASPLAANPFESALRALVLEPRR